jgi:hypothetical protein
MSYVELSSIFIETGARENPTAADGATTRKPPPDITRCPLCENVYADPRLLKCHHTFCLQCIARRSVNHTKNHSLACPLCKQENPLPARGVRDLPKNIFILKLTQRGKTGTNDDDRPLCDECGSDPEDDDDVGGTNFAEEYCTDCKLRLCKGCKHIHRRSKVNRSHTFVKLNASGEHSSEDFRSALQDCCSSHDREKLRLYCRVCKTVICMSCFEDDHVTHQCYEVRTVEKELRRQMTNDINSLSVELETYCQLIERVERNKKILTDKVFDVQNEVRQEAERLKSAIDHDKASLLRQVSSGRKRLKEVSDNLKRTKNHISLAEWSRFHAEMLKNNGTAVDVARHWQATKIAAEALSKFSVSTSFDDFDSVEVAFTPSEMMKVDSSKNVVGEISGKMPEKRKQFLFLV